MANKTRRFDNAAMATNLTTTYNDLPALGPLGQAAIASVAILVCTLLLVIAWVVGMIPVWIVAVVIASPFAVVSYGKIRRVWSWSRAQLEAGLEVATGIDLNRSGATGDMPGEEAIRFIPVGGGRLVDEAAKSAARKDLVYFIEKLPELGHTWRAWQGQQLPSGRTINDFGDYDKLIAPLVKAGIVAGRDERVKGELVITDPAEIKKLLGL